MRTDTVRYMHKLSVVVVVLFVVAGGRRGVCACVSVRVYVHACVPVRECVCEPVSFM